MTDLAQKIVGTFWALRLETYSEGSELEQISIFIFFTDSLESAPISLSVINAQSTVGQKIPILPSPSAFLYTINGSHACSITLINFH